MNAKLKEPKSTELAVLAPEDRAKAILKSDALTASLTALAKESADIKAITNPAGRDQVHNARMVLVRERVALTKTGKQARDDATAFSKAVIAEEKRLVGLIQPEEERLETLQGAWDAKIEQEKEAERLRLQKIVDDAREVVQWFRDRPTEAVGKSSAEIAEMIAATESAPVDGLPEQFVREAEAAKLIAVAKLGELRSAREQFEAEQEELNAQRQELEAQRLEQERIAKAAEAERAEAAKRDAEERDRVSGIKRRIDDIRHLAREAVGRSTEAISALLAELESTPGDFAEFNADAVCAQEETRAELRRMYGEAELRERLDAEFRAQVATDAQRKAQEADDKRAADEKAEREARELAQAETQKIIAECTLFEAATVALAELVTLTPGSLGAQMLESAIERAA